jgi:hypothetical protein
MAYYMGKNDAINKILRQMERTFAGQITKGYVSNIEISL